jgi:SAM-dependent methyltransferase
MGLPDDHFGPGVAEGYDAAHAAAFDGPVVAAAVDVLADLAGGGPALEFAIGTGRIALPLHARGVPVAGIELSEAMLAQLRAKPGAAGLDVVRGDMARTRVPGSFSLVFLVFNTIMNLTGQDEQVACFANAAAHLAPGGHFVVEVMVPDLQRLPFGETVRPFTVTADRLGFDEYDVASQRLVSHHYRLGGDRPAVRSIPFRYVWPAELDLMARLAGLTPARRWADWDRSPFTGTSRKHVSVWTKRT